MNKQSIEIFLAIFKEGSISGAARRLHFSQPTVSEYLNNLEKELGVRLVMRERGARKARLTPSGEAFLPLALRWQELHQQVEQYKMAQQQKTFRLAASLSAHDYVVSHIVQKLRQKCPDLELRLNKVEMNEMNDAVEAGSFDAAFYFGTRRAHPSVHTQVLWREERYVICPADTNLPDRMLTTADLDPSFEVIHHSFGRNPQVLAWRNKYFPYSSKPYLQVTSVMGVYNYLTDPRCWALIPASVVLLAIEQNPGRFTYRRLQTPPPSRAFTLLISKAYPDTEVIDAFMECCREYIAERPYLEPV